MGNRAGDLVGRATELARLEVLLEDAAGGRRRLGLIEAGPGLGKTTLVEAFAERARHRGAFVVWGRSWETGGAPPFWLWIQVLRSLRRGSASGDALEEMTSALERGDTEDGLTDTARFLFFDQASAVLGGCGLATGGLVIVLEDLHAADVASVLLTEFVARHEDGAPIVVVGTHRPAAVAAQSGLAEALTGLHREADLRIDLGPLSDDDVAALVAIHTGGAHLTEVAEAIAARSEGHPFFAVELARSSARGETGLPATIRDAVKAHVANLGADETEVLEFVATVGRDCPLDLLEALVPGGTADGLGAAVQEGVLKTDGDVASFTHALIRDVVYESITEARRAELHEAVARAMEVLHADAVDVHLTELAHHYLLAPPGVRQSKGLVSAIAAGARARRMLAYEQASELYERALAVAGAAGATAAERCELLVALGEARMRAGDSTGGRQALADAFDLAADLSSFPLMARAAEWYAGVVVSGGLVDEDAVRLLEGALHRAPADDTEEKARLLGRLAQELSMSEAPARARALAREAVSVARRCGSRRALAETIAWAFPALATPDLTEEALPVVSELVDLAIELRDVDLEIRGRAFRSNLLLETGRLRGLQADIQALGVLSERVPVPFLRWAADMAPFLATAAGDLAHIAAVADRALTIAPDVPDAMGTWVAVNLSVAWHRGELAAMEPVVTAAGEGRPTARRLMRAIVVAGQAQTGRREEARAALRALVADIGDLGLFTLETLHWLSEAACILADAPAAAVLYDALLPYRDRHLAMRIMRPVAYWGTSSRHLGNLAAVNGRTVDAIAHLRRALELHSTLGSRIYVAHTQAELARLVDGEEAAQLLREATEAARDLDLRWLQSRLASSPREQNDTRREASLVREGDYWTLKSDGQVARLRHTKGLSQLARLLGQPGIEVHSLELDGGGHLVSGDTGPLLDNKAKDAYRRRVANLRDALDEAEALQDLERAALARVELDAVAEELARSVGLGGRDRRSGSAAEQARINVTKLVKGAIGRIGESHPDLERHLRATVRTGIYCRYEADAAERLMVWVVDGD